MSRPGPGSKLSECNNIQFGADPKNFLYFLLSECYELLVTAERRACREAW
jgi:hypothetical protein